MDGHVHLDDVRDIENHFVLFDYMLETVDEPLSKGLILEYGSILRSGAVGDGVGWKTVPNAADGIITTPPEAVDDAMDRLLGSYHAASWRGYRTLAAFHVLFERTHPFQDGNGRVGRMILFKEALRTGEVPPIVPDAHKGEYYGALRLSVNDPGPLAGFLEQCAQLYLDSYEALVPLDLLPEDERRDAFLSRTGGQASSPLLDASEYFER